MPEQFNYLQDIWKQAKQNPLYKEIEDDSTKVEQFKEVVFGEYVASNEDYDEEYKQAFWDEMFMEDVQSQEQSKDFDKEDAEKNAESYERVYVPGSKSGKNPLSVALKSFGISLGKTINSLTIKAVENAPSILYGITSAIADNVSNSDFIGGDFAIKHTLQNIPGVEIEENNARLFKEKTQKEFTSDELEGRDLRLLDKGTQREFTEMMVWEMDKWLDDKITWSESIDNWLNQYSSAVHYDKSVWEYLENGDLGSFGAKLATGALENSGQIATAVVLSYLGRPDFAMVILGIDAGINQFEHLKDTNADDRKKLDRIATKNIELKDLREDYQYMEEMNRKGGDVQFTLEELSNAKNKFLDANEEFLELMINSEDLLNMSLQDMSTNALFTGIAEALTEKLIGAGVVAKRLTAAEKRIVAYGAVNYLKKYGLNLWINGGSEFKEEFVNAIAGTFIGYATGDEREKIRSIDDIIPKLGDYVESGLQGFAGGMQFAALRPPKRIKNPSKNELYKKGRMSQDEFSAYMRGVNSDIAKSEDFEAILPELYNEYTKRYAKKNWENPTPDVRDWDGTLGGEEIIKQTIDRKQVDVDESNVEKVIKTVEENLKKGESATETEEFQDATSTTDAMFGESSKSGIGEDVEETPIVKRKKPSKQSKGKKTVSKEPIVKEDGNIAVKKKSKGKGKSTFVSEIKVDGETVKVTQHHSIPRFHKNKQISKDLVVIQREGSSEFEVYNKETGEILATEDADFKALAKAKKISKGMKVAETVKPVVLSATEDIEKKRQEELKRNYYRTPIKKERFESIDEDSQIQYWEVVTNVDGSRDLWELENKGGKRLGIIQRGIKKGSALEKSIPAGIEATNFKSYEILEQLPTSKVETKINAKYDAELEALNKSKIETPKIKPIEPSDYKLNKDVSVEFVDTNIETTDENRTDKIAAQFDRKTKKIVINKEVAEEKFKEKAWTKSKVKGVLSFPINTFTKYEDWERFLIQHENAHSESTDADNKVLRENKANRDALIAVMKDKKSKGEKVGLLASTINHLNKKITSLEKLGQKETKVVEPVETLKKKTSLQERMTTKIKEITNKAAAKWIPKEQVKTKIATQFIGEGKEGSSTDNYRKMYEEEGVSNTGEYTKDDVIYVSSNGNRKGKIIPIIAGKLQGVYKNIDKAIKAGAIIVMDTKSHLVKTQKYNSGEIALAKYMKKKGYVRKDADSGVWLPKQFTSKESPFKSDKEIAAQNKTQVESKSEPKTKIENAILSVIDKIKEIVSVEYVDDMPSNEGGRFYIDRKSPKKEGKIYINKTLSKGRQEESLAHELVHGLLELKYNEELNSKPNIEHKKGTKDSGGYYYATYYSYGAKLGKRFNNKKDAESFIKEAEFQNVGFRGSGLQRELSFIWRILPKKNINPKFVKLIDNNISELITYTLTNKEFARFLNTVQYKGEIEQYKSKSVFQVIVDLFSKIIPVKGSSYDKILSVLNKYSSNVESIESIFEPKTKTQPSSQVSSKKPSESMRTTRKPTKKVTKKGKVETKQKKTSPIKNDLDVTQKSKYQQQEQGESSLDLEYVGERKEPTGETTPIYKVVRRDSEDFGKHLTPKEIAKTDLKYSKHERISDNTALYEKAIALIRKRFPNVRIKNIKGLIKENGLTAVGKAIHDTIYISNKGYVDTPIHEVVHLWLEMLGLNDYVVKLGLKHFGNGKITKVGLESLVNYIAQEQAKMLRGETVSDKFKRWSRMFLLKIKKTFGSLSEKEASQYLGDLFWVGYKSTEVGTIESKNTPRTYYMSKAENPTNPEETPDNDGSETETTIDMSKNDNYFDGVVGTYISKKVHKMMSVIAINNSDSWSAIGKGFRELFDKTYPKHRFHQNDFKARMMVKQFLFRTLSRIEVASKLAEPGRVYFNVVLDGTGYGKPLISMDKDKNEVLITKPLTMKGKESLVGNKDNPAFEYKSFVDMDIEKGNGQLRPYIIQSSDVAIKRKTKDGDIYYTKGALEFTKDNIVLLQRMLQDNYTKNPEGSDLLYFFSAKGGDNSSIILYRVPDSILSMSKADILKEFQKEFDAKRITETWFKQYKAELENEGVNNMIPNNAHIMLARYRQIQQIKGLNWAKMIKTTQDLFSRFRHDFLSQPTVYNLEKQNVVIMDSDADFVRCKLPDGSWSKPLAMKWLDGSTWSGTRRLRAIENIIGRSPQSKDGSHMYSLKSAIRELSPDLLNYVMIKHMEFSPFKDMQFFKGDNLSNPYITTKYDKNGLSYFVDSQGNEIEMVTDTNSAKQRAGKFETLHEIHEMANDVTKITKIPKERGSKTGAGPLMYYDQIWSSSLDSDMFNEMMKNFAKYVNETDSEQFTGLLLRLEDNPKLMVDIFYTEAQEGELQSSLQHIIETDKTGKSLFSATYISQIIEQIKNRFYVDGLFKLRSKKGEGTYSSYKPDVTNTLEGSEFYYDGDIKGMDGKHIFKDMKDMMDGRFPVQSAEAITFSVPKGTLGHHGPNVVIYSPSLVIKIKEGDFDGDASSIINIPPYLADVLKSIHNTPEFKKRFRPLDIMIFKSAGGKLTPTTNGNLFDAIEQNALTQGSQGVFVNAKILASTLDYKEFKLEINGKKYKARAPQSEYVMKQNIDVDYLIKNKDVFESMVDAGGVFAYTENGKAIIVDNHNKLKALKNKRLRYKTTFENAFQFYLQMAVDNVKYGHLSEIGYDGMNFAISKMFYEVGFEARDISDKMIVKLLNEIVNSVNLSKFRHGIDSDGKVMNFESLFDGIKKYSDDFSGDAESQSENLRNRINLKNVKGVKKKDFIVKINDKLTPTEHTVVQPVRTAEKVRKAEYKELIGLISRVDELDAKEQKRLGQLMYKDSAYSPNRPLIPNSKSIDRFAHYYIMNEFVEKLNIKNLENPFRHKFPSQPKKGQSKVLNASKFAKKVDKEFIEILTKIDEDKASRGLPYGENASVSYDSNEEIRNFVEKYRPQFEQMTDYEKFLSSLYYITKTYTGSPPVGMKTKLLPHELMDSDVRSYYLQMEYDVKHDGRMFEVRDGAPTIVNIRKTKQWENQVNKMMDKLKEMC